MVDEINLELRLCISLQTKFILKHRLYLSLKHKKRVTISDYSYLVDNSIEISNISFTPKDIISTYNLMNLIIQI